MKHQTNAAAVSCLLYMYYLDLFFKHYDYLFYEANLSSIMSEAGVKIRLNLVMLAVFYFINLRLSWVIFITLKNITRKMGNFFCLFFP